MDLEWRNYLQAGVLRGGTLAGLRQVGTAVARRIRRRVRGRTVPPEYLPPAPAGGAPSAGGPARRWPPGRRASAGPPWTAGCVGEEVGAWARRYAALYRDFLRGRPVPSSDPEETWTLHQFGWLFVLALEGGEGAGPRDVRELIGEWIDRLGSRRDHPSWRSFSISERISNWAYLVDLLGPEALPEEAPASVADQASHLATHLECYGDGSTNNHLINNGRALHTAGFLLDREDLRKVGRQVLREEMRRQFTAEGFLDEGSSHYQLIFTRAYLDALAIAEASGDAELLDALDGPATAALRASAHFADRDAPRMRPIPLVGDISPDPPPGLFDRSMRFWEMAEVAAAGRAVDFSIPWFARRGGAPRGGPDLPSGWSCHPASGHYRYDGRGYRMWWHARRSGLHRRHAHNDWGSFELHLAGDPVFIDPGRETYLVNGEVHDGRRTLAQNAALVDGLEQAVLRRRDLFLPEYLADGADVRWEGDAGRGSISFEIHCYRRLRRPVVHTRTFDLAPAGIDITDRLEGRGRHRALLAFHLHPDVTWRRDGDRFFLATPWGKTLVFEVAPGGTVATRTGGDPRAPGGYCSSAYGSRIETTTIFAGYEGASPLTLTHGLRNFKGDDR